MTVVCGWHLAQTKQSLIKPSLSKAIICGAFLSWALLSALWSVDAKRSVEIGLSLCGLLVMGIVVITYFRTIDIDSIKELIPSFVNGSLTGLGLLSFEVITNGWLLSHFKPGFNVEECFKVYEFHKPAVILSTVLWLLSAFLIQQKRWIVISTIISVFIIIQFFLQSDAVAGALCIGGITYFTSLRTPQFFLKAVRTLLVIGTLSTPWISMYILTPQNFEHAFPHVHDGTYYHRLYIWNYIAQKITEKPITGYGLDASRHEQFKEPISWIQPHFDKKTGDWGRMQYHAVTVSLHPHNVFIQWWFELGAVGAILLAALLSVASRYLSKMILNLPRSLQACFCATLTSIILIASVSYGIWQNWWLSTLLIAYSMAIFVHRGLTLAPK